MTDFYLKIADTHHMVPKSLTLGRVPVSKTDFASLLLLPVCISPLGPLLLLLLLLCVLFPAATAAEVAIVAATALATTAGT
jgi:hypothetical protein